MEVATSAFGEKMKEQVEERLRFYEEGIAPTKNITAMQARPRRPPALRPSPPSPPSYEEASCPACCRPQFRWCWRNDPHCSVRHRQSINSRTWASLSNVTCQF